MFESKILDYCWICSVRFKDSVPAGPALREDHHVIPRAFGGTDGPVVSLCETHHGILHKIAICMKTAKPYFNLLSTESSEHRKKLEWLASRVYNAELATRNDPNKSAVAMFTMDRRHREMIDALKPIYHARSREAILEVALEALYSKHFLNPLK
jgi:hypothetical protein